MLAAAQAMVPAPLAEAQAVASVVVLAEASAAALAAAPVVVLAEASAAVPVVALAEALAAGSPVAEHNTTTLQRQERQEPQERPASCRRHLSPSLQRL